MKFPDIRQHLRNFRVGIAGAGGLGSNCAVALARTGVGTILICDNDIIESGNLNRQYYFFNQMGLSKVEALRDNIDIIDKEVTIIAKNIELTPYNIPEIFTGCDVIVEALDMKEVKEMFIETVQKNLPLIPLITASGLAGWGETGSLRCRKIDDTLYVCGDESTEVSDELPPMAPRVGIVANMQADKVIEILMKKRS